MAVRAIKTHDKMNRQMVSVVIPCFNSEEYIGDAIESALQQDYSQAEVIVIDDGSTDGSLDIIRKYEKHIRWEHDVNRGGSAARNRGIKIATGKWIQFLDADDVLLPHKISSMLQVVRSCEKEIVFSDFVYRQVGQKSAKVSPRPSGCSGTFRYILEAERLQTSAPIYPRSALIDIGGFDSRLRCAQEYDLNLRLALSGWRFQRLPRILYEVRSRAGSVSSDYIAVLSQHDEIFRKLLVINSEIAVSQQELSRLLAWRYVRNARLLTRSGHLTIARDAVSQARKLGIVSGVNEAFSLKSRGIAYLFGPILAERILQKYLKTIFNFRK